MTDLRSKSILRSTAAGRQIRFGTMADLGRKAVAERGERQLGAFVLPPFQRPSVWTADQRVKLIESLWLGLPIAAYVFNQTDDASETDMWLIDGQQRWTTILDYLADGFPVFGSLYSELSKTDTIEFQSKTFPCVQINIQSAEVLQDIYERLAYGGTAH